MNKNAKFPDFIKIDKSKYLEKKNQLKANELIYQKESYCYTCDRLLRNCLCSLIKPFNTGSHFVLLMHPKEAKKEKIGTGRLSKLSLSNSHLIVGIDFTDNKEVNSLIMNQNNNCFLLYPGVNAINISDLPQRSDSSLHLFDEHKNTDLTKHSYSNSLGAEVSSCANTNAKTNVIFVIDGTWPCAKKMLRLSHNLQKLPRMSFSTDYQSVFEIKQQPADYCVSTLESIYLFIKECNRVGIETTNSQEEQMMVVFKAMIQYQIECSLKELPTDRRKRVKKGYTKKEERASSKKWQKRNIFLKLKSV